MTTTIIQPKLIPFNVTFLQYLYNYLLLICSLYSSVCTGEEDTEFSNLGLTNAPIESYFRTIKCSIFDNKHHFPVSEVVDRLHPYTVGQLWDYNIQKKKPSEILRKD